MAVSTTSRSNATDRRGRTPAVVLVSPILIDDTAPQFDEMTAESFDHARCRAVARAGLGHRRVALERGATYADAATVARAGADGLHLTRDSHPRPADSSP